MAPLFAEIGGVVDGAGNVHLSSAMAVWPSTDSSHARSLEPPLRNPFHGRGTAPHPFAISFLSSGDPSCRKKVTAGKRKRGAFADDELVVFTNMTIAVKDVAQDSRDNKPTDMHPDLYNAIMDILGFAEDDLMAALSHLVDYKAQGCSFMGMIEPHRVLWLRNYLAKYHCKV